MIDKLPVHPAAAGPTAISSASRASFARSVSDTCQPTIIRENKSRMNAA
jgi:hypothetical protein